MNSLKEGKKAVNTFFPSPHMNRLLEHFCINVQCILLQVGDIYDNNCEQRCECEYGGKWKCEDICQKPFIKRGQKIDDPSCSVKDYDDECCDMLVCSSDNKTNVEDLKIGEDYYYFY